MAGAAAPHPDGELTIEVVDSATGQPIPARIHLSAGRQTPVAPSRQNASKTSRQTKLPGSAEFGGHFYIDGNAKLPLKVGQYTFELEATPEYLNETGQFEIERHADDSKRIEMKRFVDLAKEGWYGGDLDMNRNAKDLPLIVRAEGLQVVPNIDAAKTPDDMPLDIDGHLIARTPYAWNLPVWLAKRQARGDRADSPPLAARRRRRQRKRRPPARQNSVPRSTRQRPLVRSRVLPRPQLRLSHYRQSPAAAPARTTTRSARIAFTFTAAANSPTEAWWESLEAGRVFVTNGPLLRPTVEGEPPGYVFHIDAGQPATFEIGLNLATRVPVEYLQIIKNGNVEAEVRLADWKDKKGKLPPVTFDASGWFLVRAVTNNSQTYQFASTGPYYVEQDSQPRISKKSVQFFLDWIAAAEDHLRKLPNLSAEDLASTASTARNGAKVLRRPAVTCER